MPKETTRGCQLPWGEERPAIAVVEVRWARDDDVQIVTKAVHRADGSRVSDSSTADVTDGFFVNLDRRGINDLIRHLRRARDQAFGRDE